MSYSILCEATFVIEKKMEKSEFRVLIKHCFLMKKNTVETKQWLDKHYSDSAPSRQMVEKWIAEFKRGRTSTNDAERSGRPNEAVIPENIKKIHKLVMNDRKLKVHELADIVKISDGSVFTILHEHLGMRKLCAKWVPRELTVDQKQQRIDASEECLALLNRNKIQFYRRYVTMDETWIHYYTPESKRQSAEAYFDEKEKSYYKSGIEKLEDRYTRCIALEGNYVE